MNNINLSVLGSKNFSDILNELEFNNILKFNNQSTSNYDKKILIKILFAEKLKINDVKKYLLQNEIVIIFLN